MDYQQIKPTNWSRSYLAPEWHRAAFFCVAYYAGLETTWLGGAGVFFAKRRGRQQGASERSEWRQDLLNACRPIRTEQIDYDRPTFRIQRGWTPNVGQIYIPLRFESY